MLADSFMMPLSIVSRETTGTSRPGEREEGYGSTTSLHRLHDISWVVLITLLGDAIKSITQSTGYSPK